MKVLGLDRVVIMVKDMDKALDFFSGKLGMDFLELDPEISKRDGVFSYICHETQVHLISPIFPIPKNAVPVFKQMELLEKKAAFLCAITFFVDDIEQTKKVLEESGHKILFQYKKSNDYSTIGLGNFEELIIRTSFNIVIGFVQYNHCKGNKKEIVKNKNGLKITELDRVILMINDMDEALEFFSGILCIKFKETDKETQENAYNRGCVSLDNHLHLVQPYIPMPESAPPPLQIASKLIQKEKGILSLSIFKSDDSRDSKNRMEKMGYKVLNSWEDDNDYASVGITNLYEYLFDTVDEDGLPTVISQWDEE